MTTKKQEEVHRCERRSWRFEQYDTETGWNCDGTNQCWSTETGNFIGEGNRYYCLLHAPDDDIAQGGLGWSIESRGKMQAAHLQELVDRWNADNKARGKGKARALVIPELKCGSIGFSTGMEAGTTKDFLKNNRPLFSGEIDFFRAVFSGGAHFSGAKFCGEADFEEADFFGSAGFWGVTFEKDARFNRTKFRKTAGFKRAEFEGEAWFGESNFEEYARFDGVLFGSHTCFVSTKLNGYAGFSRAVFKEDSTFSDAKFSDESDFMSAKFSGNASFSSTTFDKSVSFNRSTFSKQVNFRRCEVTRGVDFFKAQFGKNASFDEARIGEYARFEEAEFARDAGFSEAKIGGTANFNSTSFGGSVEFKLITFGGNALFNASSFYEDLRFHRSHFEGPIEFIRCLVLGTLEFHHSHLKLPSYLTDCHIHELTYRTHTGERLFLNGCRTLHRTEGHLWDAETRETFLLCLLDDNGNRLSGTEMGELDFAEQHGHLLTFQNMDLSRADFMGADLDKTRFISCRWQQTEGTRYSGPYVNDEYRKGMEKGEPQRFEVIETACRQIRTNLEADKHHDQAGDFHFHEMEHRRKRLSIEGGKWRTRLVLWLYRMTSDYGENWLKLLTGMAGSIVVTAISVLHIGQSGDTAGAGKLNSTAPLDLSDAIYTTLIGLLPFGTAKSIDWKDLTPTSTAIIAGEGLLLFTLTTLFVMAVNRRFRR